MPAYDECGIYDSKCRKGKCDHPNRQNRESRAWDYPSRICAGCRHIKCVCVSAPKPEFTRADLNLIRAMCMNANPQFPECPMYPAWVPVYETATALLRG